MIKKENKTSSPFLMLKKDLLTFININSLFQKQEVVLSFYLEYFKIKTTNTTD